MIGIEPILGCSLSGILRALTGIKQSIAIVHGPMSCAAGQRPIYIQAGLEPTIGSTTLTEIDLVLGTEERLAEGLKHIYKHYRPDLLVVILTCATSLISEDLAQVCRLFERNTGTKTLLVDGSDMAGNEIQGFANFTHAYEGWIKDEGEQDRDQSGIQLRGFSATDPHIHTELPALKSMIDDAFNRKVQDVLYVDHKIMDEKAVKPAITISAGWLWFEGPLIFSAPIGMVGGRTWLENCGKIIGIQPNLEVFNTNDMESEIEIIRKSGKLSQLRVGIEGLSWWGVGLANFLKKELGCSVMLSTDENVLLYEQNGEKPWDELLLDTGNVELRHAFGEFGAQVVFGSSYTHDGPWRWFPFCQPIWHASDWTRGFIGPEVAVELAHVLSGENVRYA